MRRLSAPVLLLAAVGTACDSGPATTVVPATVFWMEWPAQVLAATPFTVRLVGTGAECREILRFDPTPALDEAAVTFEPYFLVTERQVPCPLDGSRPVAVAIPIASPIPPLFDTRAPVPGLTPPVPQAFEMRAATQNLYYGDPLVVRTFGSIEVRSDTAGTAITRAGGAAYAYRDSAGCYYLSTFGVWAPYVLENPPDTASYWNDFVRGYLYTPPSPVCGESRVFHLVSRGLGLARN